MAPGIMDLYCGTSTHKHNPIPQAQSIHNI